MAYRIIKRNDYRYPVTVAVVGDDGVVISYEFHVRYKRFDQEQVDEIKRSAATGQLLDDALVRKVLAGLEDDVQDENGTPLPFNPENLNRLLADHGMRYAIASAWYASLEKELRKNS